MTDQRPRIPLDTLNLDDARRRLCSAALERAGSPAGAAFTSAFCVLWVLVVVVAVRASFAVDAVVRRRLGLTP